MRKQIKKFIIIVKKGIIVFTIIFINLPLGLFSWQPKPQEVQAASSLTKTTQADWQAGKFEFNEVDIATSSGDMKLQLDLGSWDASGSADMNLYNYPETSMVKVGRFIYMLRNRLSGQFMRYDLDSREWKEMAFVPNGVYEVGDLTTNGSTKIYAFAARYSTAYNWLFKHFLEYDIATDTWSYLADPPYEVRNGAALEYVAGSTNYIYAIPGYGGLYTFWRYNVTANTWETIQNTTFYADTTGHTSMTYDGSQYLYIATSWSSPDRLYRYDTINGGFTKMTDAPIDGAFYTNSDSVLANGYIYIPRGNGYKTLYRYSISGNSWDTATDMPGYTNYNSAVYDSDGQRIIFYGGYTNFWYYYPTTNSWSDTLSGPTLMPAGDAAQNLVGDSSGNLYLCRGGNSTTDCYKYTASTNSWSTLSVLPATAYAGTSVAWDGTYLYANRGTNGTGFYRCIPGDSWSTLSSSPATILQGSAMVASGSASIFALRGAGVTTFYKYDITGNSWTTKTAAPEGVYRGAGLVKAGDYIYALQGYNRGGFWRYDETANAWTRMKSLPVGSYYGGGLTYDGGDVIYAAVGGDTDLYGRQFYRYSISLDNWIRITDAPEIMKSGGYIAWAGSNLYALQGYYGSGGFWKYTPNTSGAIYKTTGAWYSPTYDLTAVSSFGTFTATDTVPENTTVTYKIRTSDYGNLWSAWSTLTKDAAIGVDGKRYVQMKIDMTGNGTVTPTVSDFTINYNADSTAPDLSAIAVSGYSASGGTALTSGSTYSHRNPYFSWEGVTDALSGIEGYYVYFGSNASADPETLGAYQYTTNYTVASGMTDSTNYYLRIKAKDKSGNISSASTGFTYVYSGISPTTTSTISTQGTFENGTLENAVASTSAWWNTKFLYRKQITVSNTSGSTAYKGDFASVTSLDTETLITAEKLQADGDDLRIVYWDGTDWIDTPRGWENLNTSSTTVYFELQANIANSSSDNAYYLYYGNSTATGPTVRTAIHDTFDDNSIDSTIWETNDGYGTISETSQQMQYAGRTSGNNGVSDQFRTKTAVSGDFTFETQIYLPNDNGVSFVGGLFLGTYDDSTVTNAAGVFVGYRYDGWFFVYSKAAGGAYSNITSLQKLSTEAAWHTIKVIRKGSNWSFFEDGVSLGSYYGLHTGDVYFSSLRYWKESLTTNFQGSIYYDNFYFNSKVTTNLTTSLGSETDVVSSTAATLKLTHEKNGTWAGYQLPTLPYALRGYVNASVYANGALYVARGYGTTTFYKLDLTTSTWTALTGAPGTLGTTSTGGITMVYDGTDSIYVTRGGGNYDFYKYSISAGTWTSLTSSSLTLTTGTTSVMIGTDTIYVARGGYADFMLYTISTNSWSTLSSPLLTFSTGSGLASDASGNIWANFGSTPYIAKYTISTNTWDHHIALAPYYLTGPSQNLVYDGSGNLYAFTYYDWGLKNSNKHYIWKFNIATEKWSEVTVGTEFAPMTGAVAYDGSRYIYIIQSNAANSRPIVRFDLITQKILPETPPLSIDRNLTGGGDGEYLINAPAINTSLAFDGTDNVYYLQGANSYFKQYKVSTKKWSKLPPIPCTYAGGGATYANGYLYAVCANTTQLFFRYNSASEQWEQRANTSNTIATSGNQGLVFDGTDTLYLLRGVASTTLYKYAISTDTWATESESIPATIGNNNGASITYDGSDNLYIIRGNNYSNFYKYNISGQTWTTLSAAPTISIYASGSIYKDGKIYILAGGAASASEFYIYDVASNTWSVGPNTPSETYSGAAIANGPGNTAYATDGYSDTTFWKLNLPSITTSYKYQGKFTSAAINLGNPYGFAGLSATVASPSATMVTFETRTSTDSADWSSWAEAINLKKIASTTYTYNISSTVQKYIQVRVTLDSEESAETPSVSNIGIEYYNDQTLPTNADTLNSFTTSTNSAVILNNTWYNYATPHFEWSGATDATGSGILGYYAYFGTNQDAVASTSGTFTATAEYTASLATDGSADGEYYLNIQTKDNAGNYSTQWSPFHYRYDSVAPAAPSSVVADPRTYTSTNSYTMFWTSAADTTSNATSSGFLGYSYKAGSNAEAITTATQLTGIAAADEGVNTFYVRSKDNAGNYSDYETTSYYYNGTSPTAPQNLTVSPATSTSNSFAFDWDAPSTYQGSISEYRYSINSLPSALNYTATTNSYLSAGPYATINGTNVFYVVAVDEADNVNYNAYTSIEFVADTTAPGIPLNPEAFDNSIRATTTYRVGLTWDPPTDSGTGFAGYAIYGSTTATDCSTEFAKFTLAGTTAGVNYVVSTLGGEDLESTTYYFCLKAYDSTNQYSTASTTISLMPTGKWLTAPDLTTNPATTVLTKSATVTWSTSRAANSFVKYGTTSGSYGNEVGSSTQETSHSIKISNLSPGTKYYYKVLWTDEDGNQGTSSEYNFTTNAAPYVSAVSFSNININSAFTTFTIKNATKATIQHGKTTSYGETQSISTSKTETSYTVQLANLTEGTIYHVRIVGEDDESNTYNSDDYNFQTLPTPKITTLKIQQVVGMPTATLRVTWTSNTPISSVATYYPESHPEQANDQINLALKTKHEMIIKNFVDATDYIILIKGKDAAGNEAKSELKKVKTSADVRPPEIQNLSVESTIVGVGDEAKAQIIVSWDTDEPSSTQVEYAQGTGATYNQSTQEDTNQTYNHVVNISGLTPSKIYHLRSVSKDKSNNIAYSFDTVVITPKSTKDALNLVVDNLSKTFGFLKNVNK